MLQPPKFAAPDTGSGGGPPHEPSISTLSGPLALQEKATGPLEIMVGKVRIDTNGDMNIDGTLTVGEVKTKSVDLENDVVITSGTTLPSGECQTGAMYAFNDKKNKRPTCTSVRKKSGRN